MGICSDLEVRDLLLSPLVERVVRESQVAESRQASFAGGPVVGRNEDNGVVQLACSFERIKDPPDLCIHMIQHGGKDLHLPCVELLLLGLQAVTALRRGRTSARPQ